MIRKIGKIESDYGQKGSKLMILAALDLPVPEGFALSFMDVQQNREEILRVFEETIGRHRFSVRSSPMTSMPGVLETLLNVGWDFTNQSTFRNPDCFQFIKDFCYLAQGIDTYRFALLDKKYTDNRKRMEAYMKEYDEWASAPFPLTPEEQLLACIEVVQNSCDSKKAKAYRRAMGIAEESCGVVVQRMVFGDKNANSGAGVLFTRNVVTGENTPYGEYVRQARCVDVVDGKGNAKDISDLETHLPEVYRELIRYGKICEYCFGNVQDIEFTVEDGKLFLLQVRDAECGRTAIPVIGRQLVEEQITTPQRLRELYGDLVEEHRTPHVGEVFARGEVICDGQSSGKAALKPDYVRKWRNNGDLVIPVIVNHFSLDIDLLLEASGVLVMGGGKTSHLAVMVKKLGLPCVALSDNVKLLPNNTLVCGDKVIRNGDMIGIDGGNIILLS